MFRDYDDYDRWETESSDGIPEDYRGMGIGLYLYEEIIRYGLKRGYRISSSSYGSRNRYSDKVWKKLRGRFRIRNIGGYNRVYGRK